VRLRKPTTWETDALTTKTHVQKCSLVVVVIGVAPKVVQLFPLEFVLDSFSIRRIPDQRKDGPDSFDEHGPLGGISVVECGLNAIIPIGIPQQFLEPRSVKHLSDQKFTSSMLGNADTLFDDVGTELLDGKSTNVARKLADDRITEAVIVEVQNVLNDVVTVRILDKGECVKCDLVNKLHALMIGSVVNTTLQDAAPVSVSGDFDTVGSNSVVDELVVIRC